MPWKTVQPVLDESVRELCARRYPGHPRGCPNYGRRRTCPPTAPLFQKHVLLDRPIWAVWNAFDLANHARRMKRKHPDWSWRQLSCCLYWQAGARNALDVEIRKLLHLLRDYSRVVVVKTPEAQGVNVTATMLAAGVSLEWPPKRVAYQVALVGSPRKRLARRTT